MMPRKRRERLERTFQRPAGQSLVFFLRLVPLTRVLVNIPAGLAKMPIAPHLAGENEVYLQTQLKAFRNGKREHKRPRQGRERPLSACPRRFHRRLLPAVTPFLVNSLGGRA